MCYIMYCTTGIVPLQLTGGRYTEPWDWRDSNATMSPSTISTRDKWTGPESPQTRDVGLLRHLEPHFVLVTFCIPVFLCACVPEPRQALAHSLVAQHTIERGLPTLTKFLGDTTRQV